MSSDEELFELCRQRDPRSWEELVQRHQGRMLNLAYQFTSNREEARDLAQDIFIRLYQSFEHYQSGRSFMTWMYSVARNLCIDHYRRRKKDRRVVDMPVDEFRDLPLDDEGADTKVVKRERDQLLHRALDTLGVASREAIVMKDFQNLSLEDMAGLLGVPIGTVKSRISRARVELGKAILRFERGRVTAGASHGM